MDQSEIQTHPYQAMHERKPSLDHRQCHNLYVCQRQTYMGDDHGNMTTQSSSNEVPSRYHQSRSTWLAIAVKAHASSPTHS